jgi:hypothetical protein
MKKFKWFHILDKMFMKQTWTGMYIFGHSPNKGGFIFSFPPNHSLLRKIYLHTLWTLSSLRLITYYSRNFVLSTEDLTEPKTATVIIIKNNL